MSTAFLKNHVEELKRNAADTLLRASQAPDDWLLQVAARNQADAAIEADRELAIAQAGEVVEALEWRLVGQRLRAGEVPMSLLAKLAEPLNKLILRAAFFARHRLDPAQGVGEDITSELDLRLLGVATGSARLFIRGNTSEDTTGSSALKEGVKNLFQALAVSDDFSLFYERLGDLGEAASHSLRDTFKAMEQEECSVELKWHSGETPMVWQASFDNVVRVRTLLDGTTEPVFRQAVVRGLVGLLALNGRLQIIDQAGRKINIRFSPKTQAEQAAAFHLGEYVELAVTERIVQDPISGEELKRYSLNLPLGSMH